MLWRPSARAPVTRPDLGLLHAGYAKACLGDYEAALGWLRKSIDANRNTPWTYFPLASCLAHLGRLDEARRK